MPNFNSFLFDPYYIALAAVILSALIYLCLYYGLYHFRVGNYGLKKQAAKPDEADGNEKLPNVSVVLTAHNDAAWLRENLVYLLEQDYPHFEVVVVDYLSQDDTQFVLKLLTDYYKNLKIVPFKEDVNLFQGKKYPLSIGIKSAANDILMLADPDCTPKNLNWLRGMVKGYSNKETKIVLGYCGVKRTKTLLGALQQYDALAYGAQYLGSALIGHPYTGSGRNLSYLHQRRRLPHGRAQEDLRPVARRPPPPCGHPQPPLARLPHARGIARCGQPVLLRRSGRTAAPRHKPLARHLRRGGREMGLADSVLLETHQALRRRLRAPRRTAARDIFYRRKYYFDTFAVT